MTSPERRLSAANYRQVAPYYILVVTIAGVIIGANLLWVHLQGGPGWRDPTSGLCVDRRCPANTVNMQSLVALLPVALLPNLLSGIPELAPTPALTRLSRLLVVLATAGLLAYAVEDLTRLHRATTSIGGVSVSANGMAEIAAVIGIGVIALIGLALAVARRAGRQT